jgi:CRISPR-associated protein (TIGR03984 family)
MTQHQQLANRAIVSGHSTTTQVTVDTAVPLHSWLTKQASAYDLRWLLLHAEAGVIWGEQRGAALALSAPAAALNWNALQQARLFGKNSELFVWQGPQSWRARLIKDGSGNAAAWFEEQQVMWGDQLAQEPSGITGFTALTEGSQGITHAPPIGDRVPVYREPNEKRLITDHARLLVRHYVVEDGAGVARVSYSRLVTLKNPGEE